jgi:hypothetical protein
MSVILEFQYNISIVILKFFNFHIVHMKLIIEYVTYLDKKNKHVKSHLNLDRTLTYQIFRSVLILPWYLRLYQANFVFPPRFSTETLYTILIFFMLAIFPSYLILLPFSPKIFVE